MIRLSITLCWCRGIDTIIENFDRPLIFTGHLYTICEHKTNLGGLPKSHRISSDLNIIITFETIIIFEKLNSLVTI